jgi:hypothetical protein
MIDVARSYRPVLMSAVLTLERGRAYLLSEALRPAKNPAARPVRAGVLGGGSNR